MKTIYELTINGKVKNFKNRYFAKYALNKALKDKTNKVVLSAQYKEKGFVNFITLFEN